MQKILNNNIILFFEKFCFSLFLFSLIIPLSKSISIFGWTRIYFFDFFLFPVLVLWILRASSGYDFLKHKHTWLDIYLFLFLAWLFICNSLGLDPDSSFEAWFLFLRCFLIYFYCSRNIVNIFSIKYIMSILCLLLVLEAGLGLFQYFGGTNFGQINSYFGTQKRIFELGAKNTIRAPGTFIQPNILAGWLLYLFLMIISWYMVPQKKTNRIVLLLISIMTFSCLFITFSRVKIVAAFIGLILFVCWNKDKIIKQKYFKIKTFIILGSVSLLVLGISIGNLEATKQFKNRFGEIISFKSESFKKKALQRKIAFQIMMENPVTGIGQRNFNLIINKEIYPYSFRKGTLTCHNIPLKIGAETGVPGFVLFCLIFIHLLILCFKRIKEIPKTDAEIIQGGALICTFVIFFDMQFNTVLFHPSFMPLFFVILSFSTLGNNDDLLKKELCKR